MFQPGKPPLSSFSPRQNSGRDFSSQPYRLEKADADLRKPLAPRIEDVSLQEVAGQQKALRHALSAPALSGRLPEKGRQRQQPVGVGRPRLAADRPPAASRAAAVRRSAPDGDRGVPGNLRETGRAPRRRGARTRRSTDDEPACCDARQRRTREPAPRQPLTSLWSACWVGDGLSRVWCPRPLQLTTRRPEATRNPISRPVGHRPGTQGSPSESPKCRLSPPAHEQRRRVQPPNDRTRDVPVI